MIDEKNNAAELREEQAEDLIKDRSNTSSVKE